MFAAFTSGIVLLLNIWGAKKSGMPSDPTKQMSDVHKCMQHLQDLETRYAVPFLWMLSLPDLVSSSFRSAGRLWSALFLLLL
jgi:hypothetical protein